MAKYFLESSAIIKRYKVEPGSVLINDLFSGNDELFYLNLAIIEIQKVFYRLWKYPLQQDIQQKAQINDKEFGLLMSRFASDLQKPFVHRIEFTEEMIKYSSTILETVWVPNIFDLAQLSSYLIAKKEYYDLVFVCSDLRSNLINGVEQFVRENQIVIPN